MTRRVVKSTVGSDGILHLDLPLGIEEANSNVQVTVETLAAKEMTAADLLQSNLIGMWAGRDDLKDSREFARQLRERAQTRRASP